MNKVPLPFLALAAGLFIIPALRSQTTGGAVQLPSGGATLALPTLGTPVVTANATLGLGLTDTQKTGILVPVSNSSSTALQILGVQASGDIFIESFPATVPAGGTANLNIIYYSTGANSGGTDLIRLLTSSGQLVIPVSHGRPTPVSVSANSLSWAIGETGPKSVTITVTGNATVPMAAQAMGTGNSATINFVQAGTYQVSVQPGNTASANRFPVLVTFNPALPDLSVAIYCTVGLSGQ